MTAPDRTRQYFRYLIQRGAEARWGPGWATENPDRPLRLAYESSVIEKMGFEAYFLILARIMDWCREQKIVYGPGRGSVGGSLAAYAMGIHELDSLEWELSFERFLNPSRVAYPDVDLDVSQRHRQRVLEFIRQEFEDEHTAVLQVAAFARAGARRTIDMVFAAKKEEDPSAGSIAEQLKRLLPDGANVTGGTKQPHEIAWWLENGKNSKNQRSFEELARKAGWLDTLLALDGVQTHLSQHAAGVVIISRDDLARLPQTSADGRNMMTGYDMYSLDDLKYLKIDILGLRTLDMVSDAHKFCGGDGTTPALMDLWRLERDRNTAAYDLLCDANTQGVFQVETSGYRKTLKEFQPRSFDHIVQLNALYRPGALDSKREDGMNMVQVFIERLHGREDVTYPQELRDVLPEILKSTQGIILYQEQSMKIARVLAGFTETEADNLRKAIGKKQTERMAAIQPQFMAGMATRGYSLHMAEVMWGNIEAASRYSWNLSHSCFYGTITWWCAFFKANRVVSVPELGLDGPGTAGFYAALINSLDDKKERQADAVAEARQHVEVKPPDVNVALESYTVDGDAIVFGLNGIKGMGEANRAAILVERWLMGRFESFEDFHRRLPSVPINMKLSLIQCGAFDSTDGRERLLATFPRRDRNGEPKLDKEGNVVTWTVAEFIKHNSSLKKPRELPPITEWTFPSNRDLADGEMGTIGFYVSADPMKDVTRALRRLDPSSHWGGEIVKGSIKIFKDRNDNEMARFTLLTVALNKQRCMVFASNWPQCKPMVQAAGQHVVVRGNIDGSQLLVDRVFLAGDYRQFKVIQMERDGKKDVETFDGNYETIELAEASGYTVTLV